MKQALQSRPFIIAHRVLLLVESRILIKFVVDAHQSRKKYSNRRDWQSGIAATS
jgi:hypothetical protein